LRRVLSLALILAGCAEPPPPPVPGTFPAGGPSVATVNGVEVPQAVVDAVTEGVPADQRDEFIASPQYTEFLDGLVTQEILYRKALEAGAADTDHAKLLIALAAREAIVRSHLDKIAEAAITDVAVAQEYEDKAVQYRRPAVHAAHLLVREADVAARLKAELDGGADFATLVAANSIDPGTKDRGGDLGWFEQDRMLPEIATAAFGAQVGQIVGPVESRVGFHLIQVLERREARPLEEVRPEIEESLKQQALDAYVREVKGQATIVYTSAATGTETPAPADGSAPPADGAAPPAPPAGDDGHGHPPGSHP
jgi:peptidyl-prolyl cis-trans isomerase C